jgi:endonuclease/exonuclease/phosphatase family metal-dependent hydrolase
LAPIANDFGYKAFLPEQEYLEKIAARNVRVLGADAAVTCAILVKTSKDWDIVELSGTTSKDSTNYVSVCLQHSTNESMDPLVVTSVHLDAKSEKKRIHQLAKCFGRARNLLDFASSKKTIAPLTAILAGDMNAEFVRGSCMSAILQDYDNDRPTKAQMQQACTEALRLVDESTPTDKQMKEWKQLQSEAQVVVQDHCLSLNRVDTGATRAAYSHDGLKNMEIWKLDHILYSSDCLTPVNKWSTLECDEVSCAMGLPNHTCPSDHLPIASVFDIRPANPLGASKRESALNRFDQLVKAQKKTLDDLKNEMETKKQVIMKQLAPSATIGSQQSESSVEPLSKKARRKKQKKEPPPKEIIAVVREARGRIKQLKNDQVSERDQLVQQFNNLERLLIQEKSGMKWREWIIKA